MSRIDEMDERLRLVEQAVVELSAMARWMKYAVIVMAASLGIDMGAFI